MKHQNITLSLSEDLIEELRFFVKKRGMSQFVEEAIFEKLRAKKAASEKQYQEAAQDQERNRTFSSGINYLVMD